MPVLAETNTRPQTGLQPLGKAHCCRRNPTRFTLARFLCNTHPVPPPVGPLFGTRTFSAVQQAYAHVHDGRSLLVVPERGCAAVDAGLAKRPEDSR